MGGGWRWAGLAVLLGAGCAPPEGAAPAEPGVRASAAQGLPSEVPANLLRFGVSGDTRPRDCDDTANYPSAVLGGVAEALKARGPRFVVDLGDHMHVCGGSLEVARAQMALFRAGTARFGGPWYMTLGNHECASPPCLPGSADPNFRAYLEALAPVSARPYYKVDADTSLGLARLVFVADDAWDAAQAAWLEQTLAEADRIAAYTIVLKHHPGTDPRFAPDAAILGIVRAHKFSLLLAGHLHTYRHLDSDNGRAAVVGVGGAPLADGGTFDGYALVEQQPDGSLQFTMYDLATGAPRDRWSVGPNG